MVSLEELSHLPLEPKTIKIKENKYFKIFELALIKMGFSNKFIPILSIGLKKRGESYYLLFSEEARQVEGNFIPSAYNLYKEDIGNILIYLSSEKLKKEY